MISYKARVVKDKPRNQSLDVLRGIALCLVLIWHYGVNRTPVLAETPPLLWHTLLLCWTGVDLFFISSGFLIAGNLLDGRNEPQPLKTFFVRRACRILPLYFLTVGLFAALGIGTWWQTNESFSWLFDGGARISAWSYAAFLQNFFMVQLNSFGPNWVGITWSLTVEEQFYLLIPWLILFAPRRTIPWVALLGIVGAPIARLVAIYLFHASPLTTFLLLPFRVDSLSIGVLLAWISKSIDAQRFLQSHIKTLVAICVACSLGVVVVIFQGWQIFEPRMSVFGYSIFAAFYGCIVLLVARSDVLGRIPGSNVLRWLGVRCYFIYLFHQPMIGLLHGSLLHAMVQNTTVLNTSITLIALAATLLLAELSWRFVERPMIAIGHTVSPKIASPQTVV